MLALISILARDEPGVCLAGFFSADGPMTTMHDDPEICPWAGPIQLYGKGKTWQFWHIYHLIGQLQLSPRAPPTIIHHAAGKAGNLGVMWCQTCEDSKHLIWIKGGPEVNGSKEFPHLCNKALSGLVYSFECLSIITHKTLKIHSKNTHIVSKYQHNLSAVLNNWNNKNCKHTPPDCNIPLTLLCDKPDHNGTAVLTDVAANKTNGGIWSHPNVGHLLKWTYVSVKQSETTANSNSLNDCIDPLGKSIGEMASVDI